jgi:CRP/FNR family cyclic AMP-dependent transcriptional regulator
MPIVNAELLRKIPLFELLDEDEAKVLAEQLDQKRVYAGEMVFSQGDQGGIMYVVQSGTVEIFLKDDTGEKVILSVVEAGGIFGELSLLDNEPRSAGAKALVESVLFIIDRHDLEMLFQKHQHAALDIMAMLSRRIREADVLVRQRVVARNVNEETALPVNFGTRLSDFLTMIAGDIRFVYFCFIWFFVWIVVNDGFIPGLKPFDPSPYGLLTLIVSLLAIFLSLFVLISQNRQTEREKVRNDIEYEVNIKAEIEIRDLRNQIDKMEELLVNHLSRIHSNVDRIQFETGTLKAVSNEEQQ